MTKDYSKLSPEAYLKELKKFRERVRVEILGQRNQEYREELKHLLRATDNKIMETVASIADSEEV